jgi:hypothetical protein
MVHLKKDENKEILENLPPDSDELQMLDECNSNWLNAWKSVLKKTNAEPESYFFQVIEEEKEIANSVAKA